MATPTPNTPSESSSPSAVIDRHLQAFSSGDEDGLSACFADACFILDGMAPHVWSGSSAVRDWHHHALAQAERLGITDANIVLGPPTHDLTVGDAAYFTAPATFKFKVGDQQITQDGATLTVALHRNRDQWQIAAWAWTKGAGGGIDDVKRPIA